MSDSATGYSWSIAGLPFCPMGLVTKDGAVLLRLEYEPQDEKLLARRLAEIVKALERADKQMGRSK